MITACTDIPPGVVNVLSVLDPGVATVMTSSPDVDVVTYAGPVAMGLVRLVAPNLDAVRYGDP